MSLLRRAFPSLLVTCIAGYLALPLPARAQDEESRPMTLENELKLLFDTASKGKKKKNEIKLTIIGVDEKVRSHMKELVGGRLDYLLEPPATRSIADDLAFVFEMLFREHGYPDVLVKWKLVSPKEVQLIVDPGEPAVIGAIEINGITGDAIDPVKLKEIILAPSITSDDMEADQVPFVARHLETGITNAKSWLESQGYWQAEVETELPQSGETAGTVDLDVKVTPGPLIRFGSVNLINLETGEEDLVQPAIDRVAGKVATADLLIQFEQDIAAAFSEEGYYNTKTRFTQEIVGDVMNLTVSVLPGRLLHVGNIDFKGYERTKRRTLEKRFAELEGTLYSDERFRKKLKTLYRTGVFSRIDVEEIVEPDDTIDYLLTVNEGTSKRVGVFGGVSSELGGYAGAQYRDHNVLGRLHRFDTEFEYSSLGLRGEIAYGVPWIFGDKSMFQGRLYAISRDYAAYDKFEYGWQTILQFQPNQHYKLSFALGGSIADITGLEIDPALAGPTNYYISEFSINQSYDRRDDPVNPRKGWVAALNIDVAGKYLGSDVNLVRADGRLAWYIPIKDHSHIRLAAAGGSLYEPDGDLTVPIDERFFQGGASSVRSFRDRRGPPYSPSGKPIGGNSYKLASAEFVGPIKGPVKFVVFADAGNVTESTDPVNFSDSELAVGAGIRINLPTGPIRLEYGHNMTHDEGETEGTLHFVIGISF